MLLNNTLKERVKEIISDPNFDKPLSNLNRDYEKKGQTTLITKTPARWN